MRSVGHGLRTGKLISLPVLVPLIALEVLLVGELPMQLEGRMQKGRLVLKMRLLEGGGWSLPFLSRPLVLL